MFPLDYFNRRIGLHSTLKIDIVPLSEEVQKVNCCSQEQRRHFNSPLNPGSAPTNYPQIEAELGKHIFFRVTATLGTVVRGSS